MKWFVLCICVICIVGCSAEKRLTRLLEKHPSLTNVEYEETIVYKDTIVYEYLPGDTVLTEVQIEVPIVIPDTSIIAKTEFAKAEAGLRSNNLWLELIQTDTLFVYELDSVLVTKTDTIKVIIQKTEQIPAKPFYRNGFWILAVIVLLFIVSGVLVIAKAD